MKHIPKYLLPRVAAVTQDGEVPQPGEGAGAGGESKGFVPFKKHSVRGRGRGRGRGGSSAGRGRRKNDPLKKFGR